MPPIRVKICGVTRPADVAAAADAGADAVGLNFYPRSPRYLDPKQSAAVVRAVPPFMASVGVFVGQPVRQVTALAYQLGLRAVQCYHAADEQADDPFPFGLVAAFRVKDRDDLAAIVGYVERCRAAGWLPGAVLVDAHVEGQMGGTGRRAPWELLAGFDPGVPLILAGGLTPENVADAIRTVRPAGVDVASGVESEPGVKDADKVRRFIDNARDAAAGLKQEHP